jgi:transposase-like protein
MPRPTPSKVYLGVAMKVAIAEEWLTKKTPLKAIARTHGVQPQQVKRWAKSLESLKQKARGEPLSTTTGAGRKSYLSPIRDDLLQWIFELRQDGMAVSSRMVIIRVCQGDNTFRRKSRDNQYGIVRRFLRTNKVVIRRATHEAQSAPAKKIAEALEHIARIQPIVNAPNRDPRFVINMDQTPVYFSMEPTTTLDIRGARTVNIRSSSGSTMRVTVALTVTAAGTLLKNLLIFKGETSDKGINPIENELKKLMTRNKTPSLLRVQARAWMDHSLCLYWVDKILAPYVKDLPPGIVPLLLLDRYKCHLMESVVGTIEGLGVQVEHIPGGCTGLAQPIDVGVNKPFKNRMRNLWEDWMMDGGLDTPTTKPPSRLQVTQWVDASCDLLTTSILKNSWLHRPYTYYPTESSTGETARAARAAAAGGGDSSNALEEDDEIQDELLYLEEEYFAMDNEDPAVAI